MFNNYYDFDKPPKVYNPRIDQRHSSELANNKLDPINKANILMKFKTGGIEVYE